MASCSWTSSLIVLVSFFHLTFVNSLTLSSQSTPSNASLDSSQAGVMDSSQDKVFSQDETSSNQSLIQTGKGALILEIQPNGTMQLSMSNTTAKPVETSTIVHVPYPVIESQTTDAISTTAYPQVIVQGNHRVELEPIDFQMNSTKNASTNVHVVITVIITAGSIPVSAIKKRKETLALRAATGAVTNISLSSPPAGQRLVMQQPETTTGVQVIFNGTYDSATNKVPVPRTFFLDICGAFGDKAFMQVILTPPVDQTYLCAMNLAFPSAARDSEAYWTEPLQCNSESQDVNDWSFRLWYKVRQYNINWSQCQQNRPVFAK